MKTKAMLKVGLLAVSFYLIFNIGYYLGSFNQQGFDATPRAYMAASAIELIDNDEPDKAQKLMLLWLQTDLSSFKSVTDYKTKYAAYLAPLHLFLKSDSVEYAEKLNAKLLSNEELFENVSIEDGYVR